MHDFSCRTNKADNTLTKFSLVVYSKCFCLASMCRHIKNVYSHYKKHIHYQRPEGLGPVKVYKGQVDGPLFCPGQCYDLSVCIQKCKCVNMFLDLTCASYFAKILDGLPPATQASPAVYCLVLMLQYENADRIINSSFFSV